MNPLIFDLNNNQKVFQSHGRVFTTSHCIAKAFGQSHETVMIYLLCRLSIENGSWGLFYFDEQSKKEQWLDQGCLITKAGFLLLTLCFSSENTKQTKLSFLEAFQRVENRFIHFSLRDEVMREEQKEWDAFIEALQQLKEGN